MARITVYEQEDASVYVCSFFKMKNKIVKHFIYKLSGMQLHQHWNLVSHVFHMLCFLLFHKVKALLGTFLVPRSWCPSFLWILWGCAAADWNGGFVSFKQLPISMQPGEMWYFNDDILPLGQKSQLLSLCCRSLLEDTCPVPASAQSPRLFDPEIEILMGKWFQKSPYTDAPIWFSVSPAEGTAGKQCSCIFGQWLECTSQTT